MFLTTKTTKIVKHNVLSVSFGVSLSISSLVQYFNWSLRLLMFCALFVCSFIYRSKSVKILLIREAVSQIERLLKITYTIAENVDSNRTGQKGIIRRPNRR